MLTLFYTGGQLERHFSHLQAVTEGRKSAGSAALARRPLKIKIDGPPPDDFAPCAAAECSHSDESRRAAELHRGRFGHGRALANSRGGRLDADVPVADNDSRVGRSTEKAPQ